MIIQDATAQAAEASEGLPAHQQTVAIALAVVILVVVVELVRKRKLREEYSILWILTAVTLLAMAIETGLLGLFQRAVGAVLPVSALFFGALLFLMLVALQFSVRLSKLTARNKTLCQKIALLERDLDELRHATPRRDAPAAMIDDAAEAATTAPRRAKTSKTEAS